VRLRGLDHLVLTVRDADRTVAFYAALGAREVRFGEGRRALEVGSQKINLHVAGAEIAPHAAAPVPGSGDICLLVDGTLDDAVAALSAAGIPVELGPVPRTGATGPLRSVYVRDPDGNLVELSEGASTP
jgi:catechol 2,3-dioxygenase-like lactoylglutathione lyase family enzyme